MQGFPGKVRQVAWLWDKGRGVGKDVPLVAAACVEGVTVWRREGKGWKSRVLTGHRARVQVIAGHPCASLLASAGQDGRLCLWQKAKSLQQGLKGVSRGFSAIAWHPQGKYLAAGGDQGEVLIWAPSSRGTGFSQKD